MLKDAIGNPIKRGWALQIDARRGAAGVKQVFVLGVSKSGNSVIVLGKQNYWAKGADFDYAKDNIGLAVEEYDSGTPEVPTYNKTPTRIVMTGERL